MKKQHSNAGRALHVTRLRYKQLRPDTVLGLDPSHSFAVACCFGHQVCGDALRKIQVSSLAGDLMQTQEELRHAGRAATLAHVVPKTWCLLLRNAARDYSERGSLYPVHPRPIAGDLVEPVKQPRGSDRSVTPAEIKEVLAVGLVVKDQANITIIFATA